MNNIGIARANVMNDEKDIDLELLYGYVDKNRIKIYDGWMRRSFGETLLNIDDQHMLEAENLAKEAIEADKKNGMIFDLARDYALYFELFKRKGDQSKAKENLSKAIESYKECGADGWVEKAAEEMAAIS
jgi:hypothetical protein